MKHLVNRINTLMISFMVLTITTTVIVVINNGIKTSPAIVLITISTLIYVITCSTLTSRLPGGINEYGMIRKKYVKNNKYGVALLISFTIFLTNIVFLSINEYITLSLLTFNVVIAGYIAYYMNRIIRLFNKLTII